jgi:hypothetical protein
VLSASNIVELAAKVVDESEGNSFTYWNKQGQSPKALQSAMDFLELDLSKPPGELFRFALCIGYEMGKTDNGLQTFTSEN